MQVPSINLGTWQSVVHGESKCQDALEQLAGGRNGLGTRRRLFTANLVREPDNPHDSNAVQVRAGDKVVGYIARGEALRYGRLVSRIESEGRPATCRAELTGGWDRGDGNRGHIGVRLCTGSSPTVWNAKVPFLARLPFHHDVPVVPLADLSIDQTPAHKAVVTLIPVNDALAVRHGGTWVGHIIGRPDLVALIQTLISVGTPTTAELRHDVGQFVIPMADCDALAEQFFALAGGTLTEIRKSNSVTIRWACIRCGLLWTDQRRPPQRWYERDLDPSQSPHVCPECGSYAYTHQY